MGLLDTGIEDPTTAGLLSLGLRLMSTPGKFGTALGQAGLGALQDVNATKAANQARQSQALQQQMAALQLQQAQRQYAEQMAQDQRDETFRSQLPSPTMQANQAALAGGGGPTTANAAKIAPVDPKSQMLYNALQARQIKPMDYVSLTAKDDTPLTLKEGETLVDRRTFKPIVSNAKEDDFVRGLRAAGIQPGTPEWNKRMADWLTKQSTHQAPNQVNVNTAQNPFFTALGGFGAKQFEASTTMAQEAAKRLEQNQTLQGILSKGQFYSGTGANLKLAVGKAAKSVGFNYAEDDVQNTELLFTQLAQRTLNSIKGAGLGAGNGFSNADREFLEKAVGGSLSLEAGTMRRLIDLDNKAAKATIMKHNKMTEPVQRAAAMQGFPMDFSVQMPEQTAMPVDRPSPIPAAPKQTNVLRFDAQGNLIGN